LKSTDQMDAVIVTGPNDELLRRIATLRISRAMLEEKVLSFAGTAHKVHCADMMLPTVWEQEEALSSNLAIGAGISGCGNTSKSNRRARTSNHRDIRG